MNQSDYMRGGWVRGLTTYSTMTSAVPALDVTATEPVTIDSSSAPTTNKVVVPCSGTTTDLLFFGTDANDETFVAQIALWDEVQLLDNDTPLWVPYLVGQITCTLCTMDGVAGSAIGATTELLVDTVAEVGTTFDDNLVMIKSATAANHPALVRVITMGFKKIEIGFDLGTGAGANVAYRHTSAAVGRLANIP